MTLPDQARAVIDFWFSEGVETQRKAWFLKDDAFDEEIRARFGSLVRPARDGTLDGWAQSPWGAVALLVLLDQFPRNLFRGSPEAFASDPRARDIARDVVLRQRLDLRLPYVPRVFLYLPFEHSESRADQHLSVALFEGLRDSPSHAAPGSSIEYAWRHWHVIGRFGRFPHRNQVLGRPDTVDESRYLAQPGSGF